MSTNRIATLAAVLALGLVVGGGASYFWSSRGDVFSPGPKAEGEHEHEDHEGHDEHDEEAGEHEGDHDHGGEDAHGREPDDKAVHLTHEVMDEFGVKVAAAGPGELAFEVSLPGEVVVNPDRLVHVVPRAPGIVREVLKSVGDTVRTAEVMAWLESAELGEARVDYLAKWAALSCCTMDFTRAQEVHDNTMKFLEILKSSPSLETLRAMNGRAMGDNRSALVSAYADFVFAKAAYVREGRLFEKKIASEKDYQEAEAEYKKADALYAAKRDSIDFKVRRNLLEARRAQQVREIELNGAERRLFVMGLAAKDVKELQLLAKSQTPRAGKKAECTDPNCKDCARARAKGQDVPSVRLVKTEEKLAWYPLRAPFDGTVIEKHLTLGEKHGDDSGAFTIADLSTVWVHLTVYQKDLARVRAGQPVVITFGHDIPDAQGTIDYVSLVVEEKTRTATARVVLKNPQGDWRPGLFVDGRVRIGQTRVAIRVPTTALQTVDDETVVFVESEEGLRPQHVKVGRSNRTHVEITEGLEPGQKYVSEGAFALKAELGKGSFGAHHH